MFPIKDKQRRKISILGGSGFIGKELISKLSKQNFLIRVLTKIRSILEAYGQYQILNLLNTSILRKALEMQLVNQILLLI